MCVCMHTCAWYHDQARFFALHALVNAIVTTMAIPDVIKTALHPVSSMEGRCNVIPAFVHCNIDLHKVQSHR